MAINPKSSRKEILFYFIFFSPIIGMSWLCYLAMGLFCVCCGTKRWKGLLLFIVLLAGLALTKFLQIGEFSKWFALSRFFLGWGLAFLYLKRQNFSINVNKLILIYSVEIIIEFILINSVLPASMLFNYPDIDNIGNLGPFVRVYSVGSNSSIAGTIMCMLLSYRESLHKSGLPTANMFVEILSTISMIFIASGTAMYLFVIYLFYRLELFKLKYILILVFAIFVVLQLLLLIEFSDDSIISHVSYEYAEFIYEYKLNQIDDWLRQYKGLNPFIGYGYPGDEEPLTWGDFALVEFYISFGYIGLLLLAFLYYHCINKFNRIPMLIGFVGSLHYGAIFSLPGQLILALSMMLKKERLPIIKESLLK